MKTKAIITLSALLVAMILASISFANQVKKKNIEIARISQNQEVLNSSLIEYITKDSLSGVQVKALEYDKDELLSYQVDLINRLNERDIKIKHLQSAVMTLSQTRIDTIVMVEEVTVKDTVYKNIRYKDAWTDLYILHDNHKAKILLSNYDSLTVIATTKPSKKFLWWHYGRKVDRVDVVSSNPHTSIERVTYITQKH